MVDPESVTIDPGAVCVLVPTYNEAATIGEVIDRFRNTGFENVLVIDGGSTDGTPSIAEERGARVREQTGIGKGQAVREAIDYVESPYVLLVDGDATYRPEQAERLLAPLFAGEADHVIGNRFADMESGAMSRLNRLGNRLINWTFERVHGRSLGDVLSGYRAFTLASVRTMALTEDGFGVETELSVECVKHNIPTAVVAITYEARPEDSETNLRPFRDGGHILLTIYKMTKTNNPLFYFGSVGAVCLAAGTGLAGYVALEWFGRGISHEVLAFVSGVVVLLGVQLVLFGFLADLLVTANREQTQQFERLARALLSEDDAAIRDGADDAAGGTVGAAADDAEVEAGDEPVDEADAEGSRRVEDGTPDDKAATTPEGGTETAGESRAGTDR